MFTLPQLVEERTQLEAQIDRKLSEYTKLDSDRVWSARNLGGPHAVSPLAGSSSPAGSGATGSVSINMAAQEAKRQTQDLEGLLTRLHNVNTSMGNQAFGSDQRMDQEFHVNKYKGFKTDFDQARSAVERRREKAELVGSAQRMTKEYTDNMGALHAEQRHLQSSLATMHGIFEEGDRSRASMRRQYQVMLNTVSNVTLIAERLPGIGGVLRKIQNKRQRDQIVLGTIIGLLLIFTWWYIFS